MRINSVEIDGFGRFDDKPVGPFDSPITIMLGPNESGKTTLLEFIRTILFGFQYNIATSITPQPRASTMVGA